MYVLFTSSADYISFSKNFLLPLKLIIVSFYIIFNKCLISYFSVCLEPLQMLTLILL